ncbi:MAG: Phospho-N-acetylmuramoyl-pentapeptide-transferase [Promethearchaeota archaeon]|nr:MAG: Phospho-N-acetylmuramoyl-pentapeptide-transferase [Candidatus Lokiarchaeota archaeon]
MLMKTISGLNWGVIEYLFIILAGSVGFLITYLLMPIIISHMRKKGHTGIDIHKNAKMEIAESGGLGMVLGWSVALIFIIPFFFDFLYIFLVIFLTLLLAGIIGYIDDRIKLRSRYKIFLTLLLGMFIFTANYLDFINITDPILPILGQLRLTVIFPILIPVIVTVFSNTVNMLEGYNGEGSGTCLIAVGFLIICSILRNSAEGLLLSAITFPVIGAFFIFNKYPAKIFPGDVGTLTMGIMIASIALFGDLLAVAFCALLQHMSNSFFLISSAGGFFESEVIHTTRDDIILLKDDRIKASKEKEAILTMPRLILAKGPLREDELVKNFYALSLFCGCLAIIASLLTNLTIGRLDFSFTLIFSLIMFIPIGVIMYKYNRIISISILLSILYLFLLVLLIIIEILILPYFTGSINLYIIKIPLNIIMALLLTIPFLLGWWYLCIKYFWKQMNRTYGSKQEPTDTIINNY